VLQARGLERSLLVPLGLVVRREPVRALIEPQSADEHEPPHSRLARGFDERSRSRRHHPLVVVRPAADDGNEMNHRVHTVACGAQARRVGHIAPCKLAALRFELAPTRTRADEAASWPLERSKGRDEVLTDEAGRARDENHGSLVSAASRTLIERTETVTVRMVCLSRGVSIPALLPDGCFACKLRLFWFALAHVCRRVR
jgi:hypothetical protein